MPYLRPRSRRLAAAAAAVALILVPSSALADSILYVKDHNVWLAAPDGSRQHQVTTDGTYESPYRSPSQADDGTIAAGHKDLIVLMRQNGEVIRTLDPPALTNSVSHPMDGPPVDVAISPDGSKVAYSFVGYSCPPGASCGIRYVTGYTETAALTPPEKYAGPLYLKAPSWATNSRTLVFGGYQSQVNTHDLGPGSKQRHWFDDEQTDEPSTDLGDGEVTRQGDKLALVRGYGASAQIRWYRVNGDALTGTPGVPSKICQTTPLEGVHSPTWSPDGSSLAWAAPDGVHVVRGATLVPEQCETMADPLVLPGASQPDWGPADVNPGPRTPPPSGPPAGGTPQPTTPAPLRLRAVKARLRTALARGLRVRVTGAPAGRLKLVARRGGRTVASGRVTVQAGRTATVRLRFTRTAKRKLRRLRKARLTISGGGARAVVVLRR